MTQKTGKLKFIGKQAVRMAVLLFLASVFAFALLTVSPVARLDESGTERKTESLLGRGCAAR